MVCTHHTPHSTHHHLFCIAHLRTPFSLLLLAAERLLSPARRPAPPLLPPLPLRRRLHPHSQPRPHPPHLPQTPPPLPSPPPQLPLHLLPYPQPHLLHLPLLLLPPRPRVGLFHRPRQGPHLPRHRRACAGGPVQAGAVRVPPARKDAGHQPQPHARRTGGHDRGGARRSDPSPSPPPPNPPPSLSTPYHLSPCHMRSHSVSVELELKRDADRAAQRAAQRAVDRRRQRTEYPRDEWSAHPPPLPFTSPLACYLLSTCLCCRPYPLPCPSYQSGVHCRSAACVHPHLRAGPIEPSTRRPHPSPHHSSPPGRRGGAGGRRRGRTHHLVPCAPVRHPPPACSRPPPPIRTCGPPLSPSPSPRFPPIHQRYILTWGQCRCLGPHPRAHSDGGRHRRRSRLPCAAAQRVGAGQCEV